MSDFTTSAATTAAAPDPSKHVNYAYGMVLGVDDLTQEFAYHAGRDRWMMRDAVGYGTLSGLRVAVGTDKNGDAEVTVEAGTAVSPRGQLIRVAPRQCANIVKWLGFAKNKDAIKNHVNVPPGGDLRLYVVLCYRDCPTDNVPIPGEPCRDESDAVAPSRLKDDFRLELRFKPPAQEEEDALRDFVKWLNEHVVFTDETHDLTDLQTFIERLRKAVHDPSSPLSPPDFMLDSPIDVMHVAAHDSCEYLRAAFRLWVTELRPLWRPNFFGSMPGCGDNVTQTADDADDADCVLLAELLVPLDAAGHLDASKEIAIDEERRPFIVHLRMLQEWLMCGACVCADTDAMSVAASASAHVQFLPLVNVFRTTQSGKKFLRLWFHPSAPGNDVSVHVMNPGAVTVYEELDIASGGHYLKNLYTPAPLKVTNRRNLYDINMGTHTQDALRLEFDLRHIFIDNGVTSLAKYAKSQNIRFVGQDAHDIVTAFAPLF
jgi:hypothetical protein